MIKVVLKTKAWLNIIATLEIWATHTGDTPVYDLAQEIQSQVVKEIAEGGE